MSTTGMLCVVSPAWFEHLFQHKADEASINTLSGWDSCPPCIWCELHTLLNHPCINGGVTWAIKLPRLQPLRQSPSLTEAVGSELRDSIIACNCWQTQALSFLMANATPTLTGRNFGC